MIVDQFLTFITLSALELILGIDNLIFISLVSNAVEPHQRQKVRIIGLSLALIIRCICLQGVEVIYQLQHPLFSLWGHTISIKGALLILGGLFLIFKSVSEILEDLRHLKRKAGPAAIPSLSFTRGLIQVILTDLVFSIDSVLTAIALTDNFILIAAAFFITMLAMVLLSNRISGFLRASPELKNIALAFIALIGLFLVAEGVEAPLNKSYLYFSFFFSIAVFLLNQGVKRRP